MFDWSNDDEILMNPPLSTKGPPLYPRTEQQTGVGEEVLEAPTRRVPKHRAKGIATQQTLEILAKRATEFLEQQTTVAPEQQAEQGRPRKSREFPRRTRESTPRLRPEAQAGTAGSRN